MGHRFDPKHIEKLENPERKKKLPPEQIIQKMQVQRGEVIADLGSGSGYFTLPLAAKVEKVYAVDVSPEMLNYLQDKLKNNGISNVELVEASLEDTTLPNASVDRILCSLVMHEVDDIPQVLGEMKRILKENGKAYLLDWEKKETDGGPPLDHRISSDELISRIENQNIQVVQKQNMGDYYLIVI